MKSGRLRTPLPGLGAYVKKLLKKKEINIKTFAARMNVRSQTASRLLRRDDWMVSELLLVGELLQVNLFEFFTPKILTELTQKNERITKLEEELKAQKLAKEAERKELEISLLREMLVGKS